MGISIPTYTKFANPATGGPVTPITLTDVYMSVRFESPVMHHNSDGTYTVSGRTKVFQNKGDMYTVDQNGYQFTLNKQQLSGTPLHTLIYTFLKTQYPGSTDSEP
jgi:hypothetical protein